MSIRSKPDLSLRLFVSFLVPGKPMGKQRVRSTKDGHHYTPERTVNYESLIAYAAQQEMNGKPLTPHPLDVEILMQMSIAPSWPKKKQALALAGKIYPTGKPDADNVAKLLDACNMVVWGDDSQIVDLHVSKRYAATPGLTIIVYELLP